MPERAQYWNNTNGQLIWEYTLDKHQVFGNVKPITFNNGESAVFVGRNKLVKLSTEGQEVWTWERDIKKE